MNILSIIDKKKNKEELSKEELSFVIDNYLSNNISDYQMSALLMAICINGMTDKETIDLTDAMIKNSNKLDLSKIEGICVDKHSTGGIGDKTTLIIVPIVASLGVKVVKMSGRSLGFTGGTIDKLESIPGFNVNLNMEGFAKEVNEIGCAISYTSENLVPADKKIYALRDVTSTVESIPLIASSIMSKKIASSANKIVIDLKVGNGALIKNISDASKLAELMIKIGKRFNREVICLLTNMDEPLGTSIGNALEVQEAIDILNGVGDKTLLTLCIYLSSYMVSLGLNISFEEAVIKVKEVIGNRKSYNKFLELIKYQNGKLESLKVSDNKMEIRSLKEGYINHIDTKSIGYIVRELGAGRSKVGDNIDYSVGIKINKKIGDFVNIDDTICTVYFNNISSDIEKRILECYKINSNKINPNPLIYKIFR